MSEAGNTIIVVRHGERTDEASPKQWNEHIMKTYMCKSTRYFRYHDPPLTRNGELQAQAVAQTLHRELTASNASLRFVFCSRLTRCIQTAYPIALRLQVPIVVCSGLALTAAAVHLCHTNNKPFEFLSIRDIRMLCPSVEVIDGDNSNNEDTHVPSTSWEDAIYYLALNFETSLVVAHRETIRNITNLYQRIPYCAYAVMKCHRPNKSISLERLMTYDGDCINILHPASGC